MASADFDSIYMLRIQHNKWIDKTPISQPLSLHHQTPWIPYHVKLNPPATADSPDSDAMPSCNSSPWWPAYRFPISRPMSQRPSPSPWAPPVPVSALIA
ncbi:hypothetical protein OOI97_14135 [Providencia stuartii]|nr:hypothetical protein [Providencia stuartii]MCX3071357.1 hypothetical protein [Providencia stuartii]